MSSKVDRFTASQDQNDRMIRYRRMHFMSENVSFL